MLTVVLNNAQEDLKVESLESTDNYETLRDKKQTTEDGYSYYTIAKIEIPKLNLNYPIIEGETGSEKETEELLKLSGVGPKVADCILLFSDLKRFEVFPIDVWVRRVMNDLYIKNEDETKVNKKQIEKIANEKFGDLAGLAQQYLFYWRREA